MWKYAPTQERRNLDTPSIATNHDGSDFVSIIWGAPPDS
jgi:hypothetical protein